MRNGIRVRESVAVAALCAAENDEKYYENQPNWYFLLIFRPKVAKFPKSAVYQD
jgi:hypothetical protein